MARGNKYPGIKKMPSGNFSASSSLKGKTVRIGTYKTLEAAWQAKQKWMADNGVKQKALQDRINMRRKFDNKRVAGVAIQLFKAKKRVDNHSGYKGVSANHHASGPDTWSAYLTVNGKVYTKSGFKTPEAAHQYRLKLEEKYIPRNRQKKRRRKYPVGVRVTNSGKYGAKYVRDKVDVWLGSFDTIEAAQQALYIADNIANAVSTTKGGQKTITPQKKKRRVYQRGWDEYQREQAEYLKYNNLLPLGIGVDSRNGFKILGVNGETRRNNLFDAIKTLNDKGGPRPVINKRHNIRWTKEERAEAEDLKRRKLLPHFVYLRETDGYVVRPHLKGYYVVKTLKEAIEILDKFDIDKN